MKAYLTRVLKKEATSTKVPRSPSRGVLTSTVAKRNGHLLFGVFFTGGGNLRFRVSSRSKLQYSSMESITDLINTDRELLKMLEDKVRIMSL